MATRFEKQRDIVYPGVTFKYGVETFKVIEKTKNFKNSWNIVNIRNNDYSIGISHSFIVDCLKGLIKDDEI